MKTPRALILATQNQKKKQELAGLVESTYAGAWRVVTLDEIGLADLEIIEDQDTFVGNALVKVNAIETALTNASSSAGPLVEWDAILADDSGLCVDALGGAPGVRSARFASDENEGAGDDANNALLLKKLAGENNRGARYVCCIAVRTASGESFVEEGEVLGSIADAAKGNGGFGYDPYFVTTDAYGGGRHMAELSAAEKQAISHRGRATQKALARLAQA